MELLARWAATDLGSERIRELRPCADEAQLREQRQRYAESERLVMARALVPLVDRPLAPLLQALAGTAQDLSGRDLVGIGDLLDISEEARLRLAAADPPCDQLAGLVGTLPSGDALRQTIARTFDSRGEIREDATPKLGELRRQIHSSRARAYQQLGGDVDRLREHLSEETIPLRGGRLVLVLQAGARGRVPGLVHGRSASGKSFYFEPLEAVEINNDLQQAIEEEDIEKRRILNDLVERLRQELPALTAHARFVAELDALQIAVRFGQASRGCLAELGPRHQLILRGARHPLLDPLLADRRREALGQGGHSEPIIPLDLELTPEQRALVITGPNAGGKTVALKTLGLLALAHQCGLPIPAAKGSRLPFLHTVIATVGDDQDLLEDRSTFSGRLMRLRDAWQAAGPDSLILLDELGSGTDPEEGAALSIALLEELVESGSPTLITTHLSQLAVSALELDGAFCASMEFDGETGRPTFRLLPGPPGGSQALALARRLGLPTAWLDRAETWLGSEHRDLRRLLAELENTRSELTQERQHLESELADAALLRQRLAEREAELVDERKTLGRRMQKELQAFRDETQQKLRGEIERLRETVSSSRRKNVTRPVMERLFEPAPVFESVEPELDGPLLVGGQVRHREHGWQGTLEQLDRGRCQVRVKGKVLRCRQEDLAAICGTKPSLDPASRSKPSIKNSVEYRPQPMASEDVPQELNVIGQRVEPALEILDGFLDRSLLAAHRDLRIIHGHGTGRLRDAVREHLRTHPAVAAVRAGGADEGGNGATVATLRDT